MTLNVVPMTDAETSELDRVAPAETDDGLGALSTERGNLPLESIDVDATITGLLGRTRLTQGFRNPYDLPLEATYIFPLPDRAAVVAMTMTADGRTVDAELKERGQAREEYEAALAQGQRASIAEEERPDVFTMRVGNILPGERVTVAMTMVGPLSYEDGEATYRLPLVVAPRYIPGTPVEGAGVGSGYALDTDAVPDASRITPPILLPGFPNPVRLTIGVDIDPAGLTLGDVRSSLHAVVREGNRVAIEPGERVNRDFVLRLAYGQPDTATHTLELAPDADGGEGTFRLTVLPPTGEVPARPRDVVLLLDRSGSMHGWKMVAARRAAARIVDTLTARDRFAVMTFDHVVDQPSNLPKGLVAATDRHRYRAVEHLARVDARGGTELLNPLTQALGLLTDNERDRVLVLVTDGQVGNEDQILAATTKHLAGVRVHTVGIDQAVNAGFLGRLAVIGGGRCELVESEDRLDTAMDRIHRRIGAPMVHALELRPESLTTVDGTVSPSRLPDLFPGVPLVVTGRYRGEGSAAAAVTVTGRTRPGQEWTVRVRGVPSTAGALSSVWARAHLRDLEDRYAGEPSDDLEQAITRISLRFGVLCRFTAWLAVDSRIVTEGGETHHITQPVEIPAGWDMPSAAGMPMAFGAAMPAPAMAPASMTMTAMPRSARGGRSGRLRRDASQPAAETVARGWALAEESAEDESGAGVRSQAASEARALRAAAGAPEYERRELLADLGTRLEAIVRGTASAGLPSVRRLLEELVDDRPLALSTEEFEQLWQLTLRVLAELAGGNGPGRPGTKPDRKAFWKR
jgi:Ca-activated chloride channel family protein